MEINQHTNPLVSVIIPCYNSQLWIEDCLLSVYKQTYKNIEVIVVDDGSTDDTAKIISQYQNEKVKYFYKENQGEGSARNFGIKLSKGELIAFLDSDDFWHEDKIELQVNSIKQGYDFVYSDYQLVDSFGKNQAEHVILNPKKFSLPVKTLLLSKNIVAGGSSVMLKKSVIDNVGFFKEGLVIGTDWEFWTRIFWNNYSTYFIDKKLLSIRKNEKSVQYTTSNSKRKTSVETILKSFLSLPNINKQEKAIIYNRLFMVSYLFHSPVSEIFNYRKKSIYYNPFLLFNLKGNLILIKSVIKTVVPWCH